MTTRKPGRQPGGKNPNAGRRPKGESARTAVSITLDPTMLLLVRGHAKARMCSLSESVNTLLSEALRHHEIDADNSEVY